MTKVRDFLGGYRLARLIRVGQSTQVWEGVNTDGEKFALKVLREDYWGNKQELAHLKREFEVGNPIKHPRIIRILEFNNDTKAAYLVMELFSALNMKLALRQGTDALAYYFAKIVEQSAEGLYYLHQQGWVHCDVKPDNFLVSKQGEVKLIDFALAQRKTSGLKKLFGGKSKVRGTRSYMSPEQIRGKPLDARADIYSFGCLLHELLAGKPPYSGTSPDDLLQKHIQAPIPSVLVANENVTQDLNDLIRRLMAKKPEGRPQDLWAFLKEFRGLRHFKKMPQTPDDAVLEEQDQSRGIDDLAK